MHEHTEAHNLHMQTCTLGDSEAESKAGMKERRARKRQTTWRERVE